MTQEQCGKTQSLHVSALLCSHTLLLVDQNAAHDM